MLDDHEASGDIFVAVLGMDSGSWVTGLSQSPPREALRLQARGPSPFLTGRAQPKFVRPELS